MPSSDVVAAALLLPIPAVSLPLSLYNRKSTPVKRIVPLLLAILAAVAGATALSVACGEPLRIIAKVFEILLQVTFSVVSIYALRPSAQLIPSFLTFFRSLAALLVACELVSALIPTSPLILPAILALVSRGILLALAIVTVMHVHRRHVVTLPTEKGWPVDDTSAKPPGRVSSPTQATWPFPGSLALQDKPKCGIYPVDKLPSHDFPSSTLAVSYDVADQAHRKYFVFLPLVLTAAQIFATLSAALNVAASILVDGAIVRTDRPLPHILLASATCTLLWSFMVLVTIQLLPSSPFSAEKQIALDYDNGPLGDDSGRLPRDNPVARTSKPSLSRRESDSLLDFLSLRDPFASSPPPPPLPPTGLGLEEVDVGCNGNMEIGMQYRFPAPRSIVRGTRRKEKLSRVNRKKSLAHHDSARTLLPVPETRDTEAEVVGDRGFGDEARLAQLLLQSLDEDGGDCAGPHAPPPVPTVQLPQAAHVQPSSRWSTSTTVQSVMSASVSNKSGVSTYTACASDKVPTSRISMNTITSVLGSRKSSDARRKSAMTASSSKG